MRKSITDSIRRLTNLEHGRSVAVLTKWRRTADDITKALRDGGIENIGLLTRGGVIETDVTVSPIILDEGTRVRHRPIVANVRKDNF